MAISSTHTGWRRDRTNSRLDFFFEGTRQGHIDATGMVVTGTLTTTGASTFTGLATMATAIVTGDIELSSTITLTGDSVGSDGEQLTSGGAAAVCDWASAGSMRAFKNVQEERTDAGDVLRQMVETPVYDFKYKHKDESDERIQSTGDLETTYTGIMADEAPQYMHFGGRILNPISTFGHTVLAIKALESRLAALEAA